MRRPSKDPTVSPIRLVLLLSAVPILAIQAQTGLDPRPVVARYGIS